MSNNDNIPIAREVPLDELEGETKENRGGKRKTRRRRKRKSRKKKKRKTRKKRKSRKRRGGTKAPKSTNIYVKNSALKVAKQKSERDVRAHLRDAAIRRAAARRAGTDFAQKTPVVGTRIVQEASEESN